MSDDRTPKEARESAGASADSEPRTSGAERAAAPEPKPAVPVFSTRQLRRTRDLLARFYGVRRAVRFYPPSHPAVREGVDDLMRLIGEYHAEGVDVPLTFFEDELLLGEQLLPEESQLFDQLIRDMTSIGATSVTFLRELDAEELERAMRAIAVDNLQVQRAGGLEAIVAAANLRHVKIASVRVFERTERIQPGEERDRAQQAYGAALDLMRELDRVIRSNGMLSANQMKSTVRSLVSNVLNNRYAMLELAGLKDYDEYTFYHSVNVAILSLGLGSLITRDLRFLSSLGVGALMHDIGKLGIELDVLNKPGALSSGEWDLVRRHPLEGAETAAAIQGLDRSAVVIILEHHMRYDLTGYPRRHSDRKQHLASRIVAVADAYDAMTSRRSYSAARLADEALEILAKNSGTAFDPALVRLFIGLLGVYPPRSVVRLSTGETGVVLQPSESDPARPIVRVFSDANGALVEPFDTDLCDISQDREIERCLDAEGLNVDVEEYL